MSPETAIMELGGLLSRLTSLSAGLRDEADAIECEWYGLGRAGGQRADHAAAMLGKLGSHLRSLERFASECAAQIEGMKADPFGRKDGAA